MGLFDNPEYFRSIAEAAKQNNNSRASESLTIVEIPQTCLTEIVSSKELSKNLDEKLPSTPLLDEPTEIKVIESANGLLIVKIVLSTLFGSLINQSVVCFLAFGLIDLLEKSEEMKANSHQYAVNMIYCAVGVISALYYSLTLFIIWRPNRKLLLFVSIILFVQLIAFLIYIIGPSFLLNSQKQVELKTKISSAIMILFQLVSFVLVLYERNLIKKC